MGCCPELPVGSCLHKAAAPTEDGLLGGEPGPPLPQPLLHLHQLARQAPHLGQAAPHLVNGKFVRMAVDQNSFFADSDPAVFSMQIWIQLLF